MTSSMSYIWCSLQAGFSGSQTEATVCSFSMNSLQEGCGDRRRRHRLRFSAVTASWRAKPVQNAFIESFNGRLRDELLNETLFRSMPQARDALEAWRHDYNPAS